MMVRGAAAQVDVPARGFEVSVRGVLSKAGAGSEPGAAWSTPGLELAVAYRFGDGPAVELRGSYRQWERRRFFAYGPLYFGLRYEAGLHPRLRVSPYVGIGPAGWFINDAGGLFTAYDAGLRFSARAREKLFFTLGASYSRAAVFHPSEFGFFDIQGGLRVTL